MKKTILSLTAATGAAILFKLYNEIERKNHKIKRLNKKIELLDMLARHRNSFSDSAINDILEISELEYSANYYSLKKTTQDEFDSIRFANFTKVNNLQRGFAEN